MNTANPTPTPFNSIVTKAAETVTSQLNTLGTYAKNFSSKLDSTLDAIGQSANFDAVAEPVLMPAPVAPELASAPEIPTPPMITVTFEAPPTWAPTASTAERVAMEEFAPPVAPVVSIPIPPALVMPTRPDRPNHSLELDVPDAPVINRVTMEELIELNMPTFSMPEMPTFNGVLPSEGFAAPNPVIDWEESEYASDSLDEVMAIVQGMYSGSGLPAPVEEAMYARLVERNDAEARKVVEEAVGAWAARNFSMPPGMLLKQTNGALEMSAGKNAEARREVFVEAAKWQIENLRFAVQQGIALEGLKSNLYENFVKRAFEAAKFAAEAQISLFNAMIGLFNARLAAFQTEATVFKTKVEARATEVQNFKAMIDAEAVKGQINQQKVEVYKAKIQGLLSEVEVYKTTIDAVKARADVAKTVFDAYGSQIRAYTEEVGAEKVKFDAYSSQLRGVEAQVSVYDSQVRAFAATMQAKAAHSDAESKWAMVSTEHIKAQAVAFGAQVDAYKASVESAGVSVRAQADSYAAHVSAQKANAESITSANEAAIRHADMIARTNIAYSEMAIKSYEVNLNSATQRGSVAMEAARGAAQAAAQATAGALAAINVSASMSGSGSTSEGNSFSQSVSTSASTSTSTNHNYNY